MPENEPVPEADALEQSRDAGGADGPEADGEEIVELPPDVPEGDALDQSRPLAPVGAKPPELRPDVPEADALDQERPVAAGDEDDFR
jgi:hypothetical protein